MREKRHARSVLVTFLGRAPREDQRYRTTSYAFDDGPSAPVAFFGWALRDHLQPDLTVVLGTEGSMWDHLFEVDLDLGDQAEEERIALQEAVERKQVSQEMLDGMTGLLSRHRGGALDLRIIPYAYTPQEQAELLRFLAEHVGPGDEVHLDITHGLRHLPLLFLQAALYMEKVKGARIEGIWYGAYDPDTRRAPVYELAGLTRISAWLEALAAYEHTGDYGVFADLVGGEPGRQLAEAAFLESVHRIGQARSRLKRVLEWLDGTNGTDPAIALFREELKRRIGWADRENYYLRQRQLALEYLSRKRYRDAVLTGWEAFTTLLQRESGGKLDPDNHEHREQARKLFAEQECRRRPSSERWQAFRTLRRLRNAVAHGSQPDGAEAQQALGSREAMEKLLRRLFRQLLPEG